MAKKAGLGPKSRVFIEEFIRVADGPSLDHMIGVAEAHAEDALTNGNLDEHIAWGEAFHLMRGEKERRRPASQVIHLEPRRDDGPDAA